MEKEQAKQEYETLLERWNKAKELELAYFQNPYNTVEQKKNWEDKILAINKRLGELYNIIHNKK